MKLWDKVKEMAGSFWASFKVTTKEAAEKAKAEIKAKALKEINEKIDSGAIRVKEELAKRGPVVIDEAAAKLKEELAEQLEKLL